jgi:hypothetical protein
MERSTPGWARGSWAAGALPRRGLSSQGGRGPVTEQIQDLLLQRGGDLEGLLGVVAEHGPAFDATHCATCLDRLVSTR